jgi:hypothetical protein
MIEPRPVSISANGPIFLCIDLLLVTFFLHVSRRPRAVAASVPRPSWDAGPPASGDPATPVQPTDSARSLTVAPFECSVAEEEMCSGPNRCALQRKNCKSRKIRPDRLKKIPSTLSDIN